MCSSEFDRTRNKTAKRRCREKSWRFRSNSSHPPSHTFWLMNVELRMKNCLNSCLSLLQRFYSLLPRGCYTDSTPRACVFGTLSPMCSSNRLAKQRSAVDSAKAHTKKSQQSKKIIVDSKVRWNAAALICRYFADYLCYEVLCAMWVTRTTSTQHPRIYRLSFNIVRYVRVKQATRRRMNWMERWRYLIIIRQTVRLSERLGRWEWIR